MRPWWIPRALMLSIACVALLSPAGCHDRHDRCRDRRDFRSSRHWDQDCREYDRGDWGGSDGRGGRLRRGGRW